MHPKIPDYVKLNKLLINKPLELQKGINLILPSLSPYKVVSHPALRKQIGS
jgi:hypothetical protein